MAFDREEKQIDITLIVVKQQITLSSVIVTASLAFSELVESETPELWEAFPWILIPMGLNILFGILAIMSVAYYVVDDKQNVMTRDKVRIFGMLQNFTFLFAMAAMIISIV